MFIAATLAVIAAMVLVVVRVVRGPTLFDRVLAGNSIGTLAILKFFRHGDLAHDAGEDDA